MIGRAGEQKRKNTWWAARSGARSTRARTGPNTGAGVFTKEVLSVVGTVVLGPWVCGPRALGVCHMSIGSNLLYCFFRGTGTWIEQKDRSTNQTFVTSNPVQVATMSRTKTLFFCARETPLPVELELTCDTPLKPQYHLPELVVPLVYYCAITVI